MAKILLINPVIREEDKPKHIPYGLCLLAAIAMKKGHLVQLYDENAWRKGNEVVKKVCGADDWDVIAIGSLTTAYSSIKGILKVAKKESPESLFVAGGGFLTSMPKEMMKLLPEIDVAVVGEAFVTWPALLKKVDKKDFDFSDMLGVCYRDENKNPKLTGVRPNIRDLDVLPYPAWDLVPLDIYFGNSQLLYSEESFGSKRRIDVNGSLGCNLVCKFCWHLGTTGDMLIEKDEKGENEIRFSYGRNIRYHSPKYIVDMVKTLVRKYDIDFASFLDENFMTMDLFSKRTWLKELCELWIKEGLQPTCRRDHVKHDETCRGVHWSGTSHASLVKKESLEVMYEAGCSHLVYGIESFDPVVLKNLGKATTQKHNIDSLKLTLDIGIMPIPNIIIGFPEDSFEGIRTTIKCLIKLGIHCVPHFATPYPGSEWFYTYKKSILEQYGGDLEAFIKDLGDASKPTATISHRFSAMELLGLQQIVAKRDLRLLDLAEKHWADCDKYTKPLAVPKPSFNIIKERKSSPLELDIKPI